MNEEMKDNVEMTGMEALGASMKEMFGLSDAQVVSTLSNKTAKRIIEVLGANAGILEKAAVETLAEEQEEVRQKANLHKSLSFQERRLENDREDFKREKSEWLERSREERRAINDEKQRMLDAVGDMETGEARDRVRMYEMYKKDVSKIQEMTPQNQTAYISGLAAILSGGAPVLGSRQGSVNDRH